MKGNNHCDDLKRCSCRPGDGCSAAAYAGKDLSKKEGLPEAEASPEVLESLIIFRNT